MSATPTVDQFLGEIAQIVRNKNGEQLQDYLIIEPPFATLYQSMIHELQQSYGRGAEGALEQKVSAALSDAISGEDGSSWSAFVKFMTHYLTFIRDVNIDNLLETYHLLLDLVQKANSALAHASFGLVILPTIYSYSRMFARLAIGLDRRPELIAHLNKQASDDGGTSETLPERAANIVRQAFVTCLNDRSSAPSTFNRSAAPEGKKVGIYKLANICLKVLFACNKTRNAEQIFVNIYNQSPPLSLYPKSERVTYLYYLGRLLFANNAFRRAQSALQAAYQECHRQCLKQKRLILIYLTASNIILGRFPNAQLYQRPEAHGFSDVFPPICRAIAAGDLYTFHHLLSPAGPHADWLRRCKIQLQLRHRCEIIVWRSLARKTFILNGTQGDADSRKAPTFSLEDLLVLARFLEHKILVGPSASQLPPGRPSAYTDPDLDGIDDEDGNDSNEPPEPLYSDMLEIESIMTSLIGQGFLNGYLSHRQLRFAIQGAKRKGALAAGFPNVWQTIIARADDEVPGWKQDAKNANVNGAISAAYGPGMVVNLSGARPVGSGAASAFG